MHCIAGVAARGILLCAGFYVALYDYIHMHRCACGLCSYSLDLQAALSYLSLAACLLLGIGGCQLFVVAGTRYGLGSGHGRILSWSDQAVSPFTSIVIFCACHACLRAGRHVLDGRLGSRVTLPQLSGAG